MALWVISPSCLQQRQGVRGWPTIPKARRYSQLNRNRQNITSRLPVVLASPHPIKGQARVQRRRRTKTEQKNKTRDRHLKQPPFSSFLFETWARHSFSHACNPYTSTSVQGNTNLSPPLDVGPSFARSSINPRVFSLHHHPGKRHAAFTRWFRTPRSEHRQIATRVLSTRALQRSM
jgi:hypothetical protein